MRLERTLALLKQKESRKLEFKEARRDVPSSLFETVCAFLNRDGGDIFLGVNDSGEITGIDEPVIDKMMKEITTRSNNPLVLDPPFILFPEKINVEGRWILYIQVPESSSVFRCKGIVYDRGADGDFRLKEPEQIAALANKKKGFYSEARVYPYIELSDLDAAVIKKTRNRIYSRNPEHPWLPRCSLAKRKRSRALFPNTKSMFRSNLLEAYPAIMSFLERHLPDPFYMEKDVRISLREKIFREAVANLLVHREYLHRYPARIIITRNQVEFTNPCNPVFKGDLEGNNYIPHQKNPLISKFFLQLGWVEEIGTGIYNVNRYLPFYAPGGKASFKEDVIFTTTIPIPNPDELRRPEVKEMTSQDTRYDTVQEKAPNYDTIQYTNQVTDHVTNHVINHVVNQDNLRVRQLLEACKEEKNREELMNVIGLKNRGHFMREYLNPAVESCLIAMTIPAKPKSSKQKYRITEKGKIFLRSLIKQHEG